MLLHRAHRQGVDLLLSVSKDTDKMVRMILLEDGYLIATLPEDQELDEAIHEDTPSLIILEAQTEDGFTRCARLRMQEDCRELPVILVLGQTLLPRAAQTYEHGADDFVPLPLRPLELRSRVRAHLAMARLRGLDPLDPITGVHSRAQFERDLDREWQRAMRVIEPISILVASVDAFDTYEAALGVEAGKVCLAAVGHTLTDCVDRAGDVLARIDPCTFACTLPDTDVPGALAVVLRMQAHIDDLALPHPRSATSAVTLSYGFAGAFATQLLGPEELLFRAQRNLLRAQTKGGNHWSAGEEE